MISSESTINRVGLVRNPHSRGNRKTQKHFHSQAQQWLGSLFAETTVPQEMQQVLADFARRNVRLLIIDGGDGTLHNVLSAFPPVWETHPPRLAIMASGNTNLVAEDVGSHLRGLKGLKKLIDLAELDGIKPQHIHRRPCLEIRRADHPQILRGMFMGAAGFTRGTKLTHSRIHPGGLFHTAAVLLAILASLGQTLRTKSREEWLQGDNMEIIPDGLNGLDGLGARPRFLFLVTSLQKLIFGIWPFWNDEGAPLRYLDIDAFPKNLGAACLALLRGRIPGWLREAENYRSGGAQEIDIHLSHPFVLDGETFEPGPAGRLTIKAGPQLEFVVP